MSAEDRLEFGMLATGRLVGIGEVQNGLRCACVCSACSAPLIARQGEFRRWHFSHAPGYVACEHGAETALHRMAKQIIAQWDGLDLPSHSVTASREVLGRRTLFKSETIPPTRFIVRSSMVELGQDGFKPDVVLQGDEGQRLAIEVWVTHKVGSEKRNRIVAADLATLEYDLSAQRHERWDRASLEVALLEMAAGWVHHPAEARIRARLEADVLEEAAHLIHPVETNHGVPSAEADMFAFETARSDALSYGVTSHEISFQL